MYYIDTPTKKVKEFKYFLNSGKCEFLRDVIEFTNIGFPDGMDIEIFPYSTLEKSYHISKTNLNKEHVTYFIRKSNLFKKLNIKANKKNFFPKLKLTLDTYNDYIFLDKIIKSFKGKIHFNCSEIIKKSQFLKK